MGSATVGRGTLADELPEGSELDAVMELTRSSFEWYFVIWAPDDAGPGGQLPLMEAGMAPLPDGECWDPYTAQ